MAPNRVAHKTPREDNGVAVSSRGRTPSCIPCRERHLKCSKQRPECTNCRSAKHIRYCTYETKRPLRFRESKTSMLLATDPPKAIEWPSSIEEQRTVNRVSIVNASLSPRAQTIGWLSPFHQTPVSTEPKGQYSSGLSPVLAQNAEDLPPSESHVEVPDQGPSCTNSDPPAQDWRVTSPLSNRIESDVFAFYTECLGNWVCLPNTLVKMMISKFVVLISTAGYRITQSLLPVSHTAASNVQSSALLCLSYMFIAGYGIERRGGQIH